jgi:hypothetical protein
MRTKLAIVAAVLVMFCAFEGVSLAASKPTTTIPAFVGDSNVLLATGALACAFFLHNVIYPVVTIDRVGAGIRFSDCPGGVRTVPDAQLLDHASP